MQLFFRQLGKGNPIIILHGLFGMSDNWLTVGKTLAEHFSVFLVDQRNHGQSPHSDIFNYQVMSDDLFEFMHEQHLDKAILIGHSMGGKTAMQFAAEHAEKVSKLLVVDIAPRYYPPHHQDILKALFAVDFEKIKSRKEAEAELSEYIEAVGTKQFLLKNLYWKNVNEQQLAWRFNLQVISKNIDETGKEILSSPPLQLPTLFLRGEKSNYITDADFTTIKNDFPLAKILTIKNAGHWIHADNPKEFLQSVMEFVT